MIELSELRDSAQKAFPADVLAPPRDASWQLIAEMGWLMIDLPEDDGGLELGAAAEATLHYELGRVLSRAPLIPALLGLRAIVESPDFAGRAEWIEQLVAGSYVPLNLLPGKVERDAAGALNGRIEGVFDADLATHVVAGLAGLYVLIPLDAPGVAVQEQPLWDETRRIFDIELSGYTPDPAHILAEGAAARALHDKLGPAAQLALAADSLGGAEAALLASVDYLKTRKQFDRPLAMFQALKHRAADLKTRLAAAEALLWATIGNPASSRAEVGAAKALACEVYAFVTEEMVQFHGGIGLTDEHASHLFLKRARLNQWLAGSADILNEAAGRALLAG